MEPPAFLFSHLSLLTKFIIVMMGTVLLPRLLERVRLPPVLGYILAGVVIGPILTKRFGKQVSVELTAETGQAGKSPGNT